MFYSRHHYTLLILLICLNNSLLSFMSSMKKSSDLLLLPLTIVNLSWDKATVCTQLLPHIVSQHLLSLSSPIVFDLRLTSSLQVTIASPCAFLALQEYTPPSKLPGLRISREQMPWLLICLNLGSSPMIIWFFIHSILGCREGKKKHENKKQFGWSAFLGEKNPIKEMKGLLKWNTLECNSS